MPALQPAQPTSTTLPGPWGQGLLSAGTQRVAFQSLASPQENTLVTTDPAELARNADQEAGEAYVDGHIDLDDAA
jgi:hypothetical protein